MPEQKKFGEFIDLFRWLPNAIATSLVQLESSVRGADDPPEEVAFLDDMRTVTAEAVHHYCEHSTHTRAVIILSKVWSGRSPFTLYLRAFHLGSKVVGPIPALPGSLFNASHEVLTIGRPNDRVFQENLAETIEPLMPILGLENSDDPLRIEKVPKLTVALDEWQEIVSRLVRAARVVVVYTDRPTSGVMQELDLIVNAGRVSHTLLVQETDPTELLWKGTPAEGPFDQFVGQPGTKSSDVWSHLPERFPNIMKWSSSKPDAQGLGELIAAIASRVDEIEFSGGPPMPRSIVPTGPAADLASAEMMDLFKQAQLHVLQDEYRTAERRLYSALVRSFVIDAARMRASVFLELGRVQAFRLRRFCHGKQNFKHALDLWDRLDILDMKANTLQELAVVEDLDGNSEAAKQRVQEALAVPLAVRDYWGEFCCWNLLYGIAWRQGQASEADAARLRALEAYHEFRSRGGVPPQPATRCLAAFLGFVAVDSHSGQRADVERYRSWLRERQGVLQCELADEMIRAVYAYITNRLSEDELIGKGEGLDQGWELLRFVNSLR